MVGEHPFWSEECSQRVGSLPHVRDRAWAKCTRCNKVPPPRIARNGPGITPSRVGPVSPETPKEPELMTGGRWEVPCDTDHAALRTRQYSTPQGMEWARCTACNVQIEPPAAAKA